MILIHRLTPFAIGLIASLGFASLFLIWFPPLLSLAITIILIALLYARLLHFKVRTFQFWHFLGTPILYLLASFGMIFLFEQPTISLALAILSVLFLVLFSEYIFQFTHLTSQYQPYSIEYLTLLLNVLTIFFLSSVAYGVNLLVQTPLWALAPIFFLLSLFILYGTLWVSKVDEARSKPYAIAGSILTTEFFVTLAFLPSGLYTNAALITLFFYLFLGLTRAEVRHKLSKQVALRYLITSAILLILIVASANWL
ncbi:hypothetical protein HY771_03345 [Candidatus Uhrbacteria bacterium]|nr:hypothetical protein [Candidatus Uhrbacteria bacterium]